MGTRNESLVGQVVEDRYRIEAALGRGAMGMVYRGRHIRLGREVAIKVMHDHLLGDTQMVARFEREATAAARLHHKNLVNVIDVGETSTHQKLMVLELAKGPGLDSIMGLAALPPTRVVHLVKQLLHGLAHAHDAGLVHRDLKPENVIVELAEDGTEVAKIVDFGIAILRGRDGEGLANVRLTDTGMVMGTPHYMSPEQAKGQPADPRTDLFALGVMTYEMLAGVRPFDGDGMEAILANVSQDPPPIGERAGVAIDPLLEAFVCKLMARRVTARFRDARTALEVLELIERDPTEAAMVLGLADEKVTAVLPVVTVETPPATLWQRVRKYFRK